MLVGVVLGMAGCAIPLREDPPGPDRPRLVTVAFEPDAVRSGCPVTLTIRFEDEHADVIAVQAYWEYRHGSRIVASGVLPLPVTRATLIGTRAGTVSVTRLFHQAGRYLYWVQIEDASGRKSNVLPADVLVSVQPRERVKPCRTDALAGPRAAPLS